ncbi:uncharacterized protein LOC112044107 [Bicyclus anynana]|uniref:Uncharacterized protein LOC112044107 n=1 Tax=Bicyclus anynana TaxID=110368 RepID=A0ABM3LFI3_BICAN|nr:uncharacterized protein LOC112044107 [Bicyclus anynana]
MDEKRIVDFPYEFEELDDNEVQNFYSGVKADYITVGPKKYFMTTGYLSAAAKIYNFPVKSEDTFIVTFPKSGTTMTQELVWLLCNNLDYERAKSINLSERSPFLEISTLFSFEDFPMTEEEKQKFVKSQIPTTHEDIEKMPSPRFIKTHLPLSLLPPYLLDTTKVVYVARDPRDVAVSFYKFQKFLRILTPDKEFKQYWKFFLRNHIPWTPYFDNVLEAWEQRNHPNMLFLFYEDMVKDLPGTVRLVANFYNKSLSEEQVNELADHLRFDNFKQNKSVNMEDMKDLGIFTSDGAFIRKGKPGGWRKYFDEEMAAEAEEWIAKHLRDTDFRFPHLDIYYNDNERIASANRLLVLTKLLCCEVVLLSILFVAMDKKRIENFPYDFEELDPQENEEITNCIRGYKEEFIRVGPKKYFVQKRYVSVAAAIYNFPLRSDDTYVITFTKSGTTLTQELVWLICNNLDYEKAASTILNKRFPFLEVAALVPAEELSYISEDQKKVIKQRLMPNTIKEITEMASPRFIKSHMPMSLLPPSLLDKTKVVYMMRDPRDVAVSYYHHLKLMKQMKPDKEFKPFWNYFVSDNIFWAPFFDHVLEAWEKRNHPNMLFLIYEDVIKDMPGTVRRVADFFGKTISDEQVNKLADHLGFDNFKKNKSVNMEHLQESGVFTSEGAFIRKGQPGEWREYFDEEMTAQAEEWIAKNLRGTDLRLPNC